jgi:hypothetical protein
VGSHTFFRPHFLVPIFLRVDSGMESQMLQALLALKKGKSADSIARKLKMPKRLVKNLGKRNVNKLIRNERQRNEAKL